MNHATMLFTLAAALLVPASASAQAQPQAQQPKPPASDAQAGFFRPAADPALTTVPPPRPEPVAPQATPDMAGEVRRAETASLERIEAAMDRVEHAHARAAARPAPLPPIASPLDGTASIMSPLDGTAPLVTPTNR